MSLDELKGKEVPWWRFSVAPMLDWTDRHCRFLLRQLSKRALLYTEMASTGSLIYGNASRFLKHSEIEHPLALQLGGHDPKDLALCAKMGEDWGYQEINLNIGCPSPKATGGSFGVCLMKEPELVARCVVAMKEGCNLPVTVKTRIGVDDQDSYEFLYRFVKEVSEAGCKRLIVHARKAWLKGLDPKQNRTVPPIHYDRVERLKEDFPHLCLVLNGELRDWETSLDFLKRLDGVMIGRFAYHDMMPLQQVDELFYHQPSTPEKTRKEIVEAMYDYTLDYVTQGGKPWHIVRHWMGLFHKIPGGKGCRRFLNESLQSVYSVQETEVALKRLLATLEARGL